MARTSRWQAKHKACQEAVTNVATDLKAQIDRLQARVMYLERLLDRAYPLLHNPYGPKSDARLAVIYRDVIREVEVAIQHLTEEDDPERVELPCGSCDGDGCPNCAMDAILRADQPGV